MDADVNTRKNKKSFLMLFWLSCLLPTVSAFANLESYTYTLTQSTAAYQLWTTLPSERVFEDTGMPSALGVELKVYAAKNEFEPFQMVVKPSASGPVTININDFGFGITSEIFQVKYVNITTTTDYLGRSGYNPDPLWPVAKGESVNILANKNTAFWFSIHVPKNVGAGDYTTSIKIGPITIPVTLHVFNFNLPDTMHVKSQMNFNYSTVLTKYGVSGSGDEYWSYLDKMKQFFIDHRLTPKSVLWSGGLTAKAGAPYIGYDCTAKTFNDTDGIWGFELPASRYLAGNGLMEGIYSQPFNDGVGFPSSMTITFTNNDASLDQRPSSFCGSSRSATDWYTADNPNSTYNQKWFGYMTSIQEYLDSLGYLDKAYYYLANEPQDQVDYDAVAWYSQELKKAAPNLKLMISEEPKPEIYSHPTFTGSKIDIWLAHLGLHFDPAISQERMRLHDEETWIYFLHGTRLPRFNPLTIDHPGIEGKLTGWFLWKYRLRGIAYYSVNDWSVNPWSVPLNSGQNGNLFLMYPPSEQNQSIPYGSNNHRFVPSIRLEMIRDGLEDYEYFYLLNGGNNPQPDLINPADEQVDKIIGYTVAYNRDSEFLYNLRRLVGLKIGGEIETIEEIFPTSTHPRSIGTPGNYYINFQDPTGQPTGPVSYNGHNYIKIGDALYTTQAGYGWLKAAEVPDSDFYPSWDEWIDGEPKSLLASSVIDSWGREDVFEFDLPNGLYNVTACAGSRSSPRYQNIVIEGVAFMDDEETNNSWISRTKKITIKDKKLTLVMGKYDKIGYINYLDIEAVSTDGDVNCDETVDLKDLLSVLQIISGGALNLSLCSELNGDMDGNHYLGIEDALGILQLLGE